MSAEQITTPAATNGHGADEEGRRAVATAREAKDKTSVPERIVGAAIEAGFDLVRSPEGGIFATFSYDGRAVQTWPLDSPQARAFLQLALLQIDAKARTPSRTNVAEAVAIFESKAHRDAPVAPVHTRVAPDPVQPDRMYLDLTDEDWRVVEVDADGWRTPTLRVPVCFRRGAAARPLPEPRRGGSIDELRPFVNVASDRDFMLVVAWLIAALQPHGPYPVLLLHGEQGAAKSTTTRVLRRLVDPNAAPTRDKPREPRDLAVSARHSHVLAFDNLGTLPEWLSDALCRVATGAGFATRELYSDDGEVVFHDTRPIIANGIEAVASRGDLLSRSIVVELPTITGGRRRTEAELERQFEQAAPRILGTLLDAVSASLRDADGLELDDLPRMADFARRAEAGGRALGWRAGAFLDAYRRNARGAVELELGAAPVAQAVRTLLADPRTAGEWLGSAQQLRRALAEQVEEAERGRGWPRSDKALHGALKRLAPALRSVGVEVDREHRDPKSRRRLVRLWTTGADVSATCPPDTSNVSGPTQRVRENAAAASGSGHIGHIGHVEPPSLQLAREEEKREEREDPPKASDVSDVSARGTEHATDTDHGAAPRPWVAPDAPESAGRGGSSGHDGSPGGAL